MVETTGEGVCSVLEPSSCVSSCHRDEALWKRDEMGEAMGRDGVCGGALMVNYLDIRE